MEDPVPVHFICTPNAPHESIVSTHCSYVVPNSGRHCPLTGDWEGATVGAKEGATVGAKEGD